jgi:tetratricopeptide (TPR) repeat protein/DNA-binding CsgD family transcriptional regulator
MQENFPLFDERVYEHLSTINGINFTRREIDILSCLVSARRTNQIASILSISPRTVTTHFRNIMLRLGCNSQDRIISFIEKSGTLYVLREYYCHLMIEMTFQKSLKKLVRFDLKKAAKNIVLYWSDKSLKDALALRLLSHLKHLGINAKFQELHESLDKQKTETVDEIIFLLLEIPEKEDPLPNLSNLQIVYFSHSSNYYLAIFEILKIFLPNLDVQKEFAAFLTSLEGLYVALSGEKTQNKKEDGNIVFGEASKVSIEDARKSSSKNKTVKLEWLAFLFILLGLGLLINLSFNPQEIVRSDMSLPTESTLLNQPDLLNQLDEKFKKNTEIQVVALIGPGGSGKTVLSRQYARRQNDRVVWEINAENLDSLRSSFENLAKALARSERYKSDLRWIQGIEDFSKREEAFIQFVRCCLKYHKRWFLIFDNVERFEDVQKYLPQDPITGGNGKILLTTRNNNIQNHKYIQDSLLIPELNPDQKFDLFRKIVDQGGQSLIRTEQIEKVKAFLEHLPPFPLDILFAAYYLKTTNTTYDTYLDNLAKNSKDLELIAKSLLKGFGDYPQTRYSLVTLSLEHIISINKDFQDLFLLISLLGWEHVPKALLEKYKNKPTVDDFIYNLKKHSLILSENSAVSGTSPTFSIHHTTQAIMRSYILNILGEEKAKKLTQDICNLLDSCFKNFLENNCYNEIFCQKNFLINHLISFVNHKDLLDEYTIGIIYRNLGVSYGYLKNFINSKIFLEKSLFIFEKTPVKNYSQLVRTLKNLGVVYKLLGKQKEARACLEKVILIYKNQHLPKTDAGLYQALLALGDVYRRIRDYSKAQELYEQSLAILEENYPDNKTAKFRAIIALGVLYKQIGNYQKARFYLEDSFTYFSKSNEKKFLEGEYIWSAIYLGDLYLCLGYPEKAKEYVQKGFNELQKNFSQPEPGLGGGIIHLGKVLMNLGECKKALSLFEQGEQIFRKSLLPENDFRFAWTFLQLGDVYLQLGNYKEAKKFLHKSLDISQCIGGSDHIETGRVLRSLGLNELLSGHGKEAEEYLTKALIIFENKNHPDIYMVFESLADLYLFNGKKYFQGHNIKEYNLSINNALNYLNKAQDIIKKNFPPDSLHFLRVRNKIELLHKNNPKSDNQTVKLRSIIGFLLQPKDL